jgi:uncharacterized protein (TIGR00251 family)
MLRAAPEGTVVEVRVVPRAAKSRLSGVRGGALLVHLAAPPVDGAANAALLTMLSDVLGVPRRAVTVIRGDAARRKAVLVTGLSPADVHARLALAPTS